MSRKQKMESKMVPVPGTSLKAAPPVGGAYGLFRGEVFVGLVARDRLTGVKGEEAEAVRAWFRGL